mgnify:CR=1 FL=1
MQTPEESKTTKESTEGKKSDKKSLRDTKNAKLKDPNSYNKDKEVGTSAPVKEAVAKSTENTRKDKLDREQANKENKSE